MPLYFGPRYEKTYFMQKIMLQFLFNWLDETIWKNTLKLILGRTVGSHKTKTLSLSCLQNKLSGYRDVHVMQIKFSKEGLIKLFYSLCVSAFTF